jgi:hypothetical protein
MSTPRIGRRPRASSASDNRITVRFSDAEAAALDALRLADETRSDALRRLVDAAAKTHAKSRTSKKSA